jgi:hypothetical protein
MGDNDALHMAEGDDVAERVVERLCKVRVLMRVHKNAMISDENAPFLFHRFNINVCAP